MDSMEYQYSQLSVDVLYMPGLSPMPLAPGDAERTLAASGLLLLGPLVLRHISVQEFLSIVSCAIWGSDMAGHHICCLCDNAAVVVMTNKHTNKYPMAMHLLRCLFFICAQFNITFTAEHIAGITNEAADALSRNNLPVFFLKVPSARQTPSAIPPAPTSLLEILVNQSPNWLSAEWSSALQACV